MSSNSTWSCPWDAPRVGALTVTSAAPIAVAPTVSPTALRQEPWPPGVDAAKLNKIYSDAFDEIVIALKHVRSNLPNLATEPVWIEAIAKEIGVSRGLLIAAYSLGDGASNRWMALRKRIESVEKEFEDAQRHWRATWKHV